MYAQRVFFRSTQRLGTARTALRRRLYSSETKQTFVGAEDNEFNRERARVQEHAAASGELWRKLTIYVAVPCMILASINGKMRWDAHWEHKSHEPPLEEKPEYSYQNIRTKNFWWGDGDKASSSSAPFWRPHVLAFYRDSS
ncbi:cytochrome c oxidase subunit VIa-domain-containing protein [Clohesyomyces aquaticus]|uniref:Cytochrome c oxidase subunit VIa-domain-containing protein n=1 Tax=Clohesyomyces aquaticus TaxID=1231657 RepID=A0A1Y1ZNZ2_9PLEO|nr:cytochrome c oxidase subunit VIa-domain-containing protein [Clohesyomyces aquaticus]